MHVAYPYHIDTRGRTAGADDEEHVREQIEQVLFTAPGERVNRPEFGAGLLQLVFAPNSDLLATAVQASVQAALQQWLGELIQVMSVQVQSQDATLTVTVGYTLRKTQRARIEQFTRSA
jgi:phage baseplate assembly protein W